MGWLDHTVPPALTMPCTQPGELRADGSMTCDGRPPGICGWACRMPSSTHSSPKPTRSTRRADGSATGAAEPAGPDAAGTQFRDAPHSSSNATTIAAASKP